MNLEELAAAIDTAAEEIAAVIDKHSEALGPSRCTLHGVEDDDCDSSCVIEPSGDILTRLPLGWLLTISYGYDPQAQGDYVQFVTPPRQSTTITNGLIRDADKAI